MHLLCILRKLIARKLFFFAREIGLSEDVAFMEFNVAPLGLRRDIGMLGLLFKIATGQAHPAFSDLFPRLFRPAVNFNLRHLYHQL